jgi:nucleoid DNA-binding protein
MTGSFRTPRRYDLPEGFVDAVGAAEDTIRWNPSSVPEADAASEEPLPAVTNAELVRELVERAGMSKTEASKALNVVVEIMVEHLAVGQAVTLRNFGTFRTSRSFADSKRRAAAIARKTAGDAGSDDAVQFVPGGHLRHAIEDQEF